MAGVIEAGDGDGERIDDSTDRYLYQVELGERIRGARDTARVSRQRLAEAIGISYQYLYQIETGLRRASLGMVWRIAMAIGADPQSLDPRLARVGRYSKIRRQFRGEVRR
jgi:transcriptional regulator with XRE-family HTH domain